MILIFDAASPKIQPPLINQLESILYIRLKESRKLLPKCWSNCCM